VKRRILVAAATALFLVLFVFVGRVQAETVRHEPDLAAVFSLAAPGEKCADAWYMPKICVKAEVVGRGFRVGVKVSSLPYAYLYIVKNGCFNLNPTRLLANLQVCVEQYNKRYSTAEKAVTYTYKGKTYTTKVKVTITNVSFKYFVRAKVGVGWASKTWTSTKWSAKYSY